MEKEDNKMSFMSFGATEYTVPTFNEDGNKDWVNFGEDNLYDRYLLQLFNNSPKHESIISRKVNLIASGEWNNTNPTVDTFIKNENGGEDLNDIIYKNAYNLMNYGGFALVVTWSKDRKSIARIKFIDVAKIRIAKDIIEKDDADRYKRQEDGVPFYYVSSDWANTRREKNKPELFQGYSQEYSDVPTQILYVKQYRPNSEYYGLPDWLSAQQWINLDYEVANFHNNNAINGYAPSMVIKMRQGVPSMEEMKSQKRKMAEVYKGSSNAGKIVMTFSEPENDPIFEPIETNDNDTKFLDLETFITNNIINIHKIPGILATRETAGKLGGTEIIEASVVFQNEVIGAYQKLINRTYTKLLNVSSPNEVMELNKVVIFPEEVEVVNPIENTSGDNKENING